MNREKVQQVLDELLLLVDKGVGPSPPQIDGWINLLEEALKEGGD